MTDLLTDDVVGRVLAGHPIRSDNERQQVAQAVADYENRLAGGEFGCGPAEPAPPAPLSSEQLRELAHDQGRWMSGAYGSALTAQQLRSLAQIREAEERAEAGIEPPISWCGLGYEKYQNDLEAAQRLWNNKQEGNEL